MGVSAAIPIDHCIKRPWGSLEVSCGAASAGLTPRKNSAYNTVAPPAVMDAAYRVTEPVRIGLVANAEIPPNDNKAYLYRQGWDLGFRFAAGSWEASAYGSLAAWVTREMRRQNPDHLMNFWEGEQQTRQAQFNRINRFFLKNDLLTTAGLASAAAGYELSRVPNWVPLAASLGCLMLFGMHAATLQLAKERDAEYAPSWQLAHLIGNQVAHDVFTTYLGGPAVHWDVLSEQQPSPQNDAG